jgi:hypothetical protein
VASPNAQIVYTAKRRLKTGVNVDDEVTLDVILTQWDRSTDTGIKQARTLSGSTRTTLMYFGDQWSVEIAMIGDYTQADVDQFFYSTLAGEAFSITDLDADDPEEADAIDVKRVGGYQRTRKSTAYVGRFDYRFRVEEAL